jgi:hypothetical protein
MNVMSLIHSYKTSVDNLETLSLDGSGSMPNRVGTPSPATSTLFVMLSLSSHGPGPTGRSIDGRRTSSATGGAFLNLRRGSYPSSSTMTIIHTPTVPFLPSSGVQCTHRALPSVSPIRPETHRTLAVTPRPEAKAFDSSARTLGDPPMRERNGD